MFREVIDHAIFQRYSSPCISGHRIVVVRKAGGLVVWVRFPVARQKKKIKGYRKICTYIDILRYPLIEGEKNQITDK